MESNTSEMDARVQELWRKYLVTGELARETRQRRFFRMLPGTPRCKNCYAPFKGPGSRVVRVLYGKKPSNLNPQLCNVCEMFAREYPGGAEVELSLLFVDVRGSTTMAENMNTTEYSRLIDRFYKTATNVMVHTDALIDKIIGDQAAGMYVPGLAGAEHARRAVQAGLEILKGAGYGSSGGPWIPLGAGVHTGKAFVGALGSKEGTTDITVLGDTPNTAARLSSRAGEGEILISESACTSAGIDPTGFEKRSLELKGKSEPMDVWVMLVD
ncbi:MAG: adenylate/guanylate cyclase domain-containing protein [Anaerolineales bacterium]|jgi:adenylate cyclase